MRIDFEGNLIWKDVVDTLRTTQTGNIVVDSQFIYMATYKSNSWEDKNIRLLKFDFDGNLTGYQLTGAGLENERPMSLDWYGDRLLAAFDERIPNGNITTVTANMAWYSKSFDSLKTFEFAYDPYGSNSLGFIPTSDGNLFHLRTVSKAPYQEARLFKIDTSGTFLWEKLVGKCDYPPSSNMALLPDDEVVVRWYEQVQVWSEDTFEYANVVAKYDTDGNQLYKQYLYSPYLLRKELDHIFTTQNGDIVGCGYYILLSEDPEISSFFGGWIFRMDSDGNLKWQRYIADNRYPSGQFLLTGLEMPNGDLVFGGVIGLPGPPEGSNVWLLRTDSTGCLTPDCGDFQEIVPVKEPPPSDETGYQVYPNPAHAEVTVKYPDAATGASLEIYDRFGRYAGMRLLDGTGSITLPVADLPGGIYAIKIASSEATLFLSKLVIFR
jgi:hypothetical protein